MFLLIISTLPVLLSVNNMFFWDTVQLASKHATWFYSQNFNTFFLPENIDSGHIPVFGYYLAVCWKIFGRNLLVSHLAMLPFVWITVFYAFKIAEFLFPKYKIWLVVFIIAEPTYFAQTTLVSPDIWLAAFFLMHLYAKLDTKKKHLRIISSLMLALVSLRGLVVLTAFEITLLIGLKPEKYLRFYFKDIVPALLIWLAYETAHFFQKHWIGWHSQSPWAESFRQVDFYGILYNTGLFGWRLLDFGRWALWLSLIVVIFFFINTNPLSKSSIKFVYLSEIGKNTQNFPGNTIPVRYKQRKTVFLKKCIFLLLYTLIFMLYLVTVPFKGLTGHRYYIPIYFSAILSLFLLFSHWTAKESIKKILLVFVLFNFIAGYFWVYPVQIAQGWDSSPAYLPFIKQEKALEDYIKAQGLDKNKIGADFPLLSAGDYLFLNNDSSHFKAYDLKTDSLIVFSNVFNNFSDREIVEIQQWKTIEDFSNKWIILQLKAKE